MITGYYSSRTKLYGSHGRRQSRPTSNLTPA